MVLLSTACFLTFTEFLLIFSGVTTKSVSQLLSLQHIGVDSIFHQSNPPFEEVEEDSFELFAQYEENEEVDGSIGDEGQMTEAFQAENPGWRHEL